MMNRTIPLKFKLLTHLFVVFFVIRSAPLIGQEGEPTSSLPAGFGVNQFQTTENLSSGVLNINLPIENVVIPVSLNYTTTGIRVNQRPGIVGLGWNLNAGGFIMRQKRGLADDHEQGYSGQHNRGSTVSTTPTQANFPHLVGIRGVGVQGGQVTPFDPEPDLYQFQFLGQGGTFTLDHNRNVVKLSANNLRIEPTYNTSTNKYESFKITDEQGNQYQFTLKETVRTLVDNVETEKFTHKWHLTKVTYYASGEDMIFSYTNAPLYKELTPFRVHRWDWGTSNSDGSEDKTVEQEYTAAKLLTSVTFQNTKVEFTYGTRTDITNLRRLNTISYKVDGVQRTSYSFSYKYLGQGSAKRLMLAGVTKPSLGAYLFQFTYYGERAFELTLPAYNSYKQDHWGFYNTNTQSTLYGKIGANRAPNLANTQANTLKRVYDISGGFEEYEYQLNEYRLNNTDHAAGGLRIHKVRKKDDESIDYQMRTYSYDQPGTTNSSGELYAEPDYYYEYRDLLAKETLEVHHEFSLNKLIDEQGRHLVYEYVTATDIDGGQTQFKFKTFSDERTLLGSSGSPTRFAKGWNRTDNAYESPGIVDLTYTGPFGFNQFKGVAAGLLEEKLVKDVNGNWLIREAYTYVARAPTATVKGMNFLRQGYRRYGFLPYNRIDEFLVSVYELGYGYMLNTKIEQTTYDVTNFSNYKTVVTDITYDASHPLPDKQETYLFGDKAPKRSVETDYLFRETNPPSDVSTYNLLSLVKETRSYVGTTEIAKNSKAYSNTPGGKLAVWTEDNYSQGNLVDHAKNTYNSKGYLINRQDGMSGFNTAAIYDDNGKTIAEASNATVHEIAYTSFENEADVGWSLPTLIDAANCGTLDDCQAKCGGNSDCEVACEDHNEEIMACLNGANLATGFIDKYAYKLEKGNVTKSLAQDTYRLTLWKKSGTVSISGASSTTLLETKTLDGWTFEEWEVVMSTASVITLSGSAIIDHLGISPADARMNTYTYHPLFGKLAEMDANNNLIFYEYDLAGRQTTVKDENQDILSHTTHHIAGYLDVSEIGYSPVYTQSERSIFVTSNKAWTATDDVNWITVSRENNSPIDKLIISCQQNNLQSVRQGTVTISGSGLTTKTISVTQQAAPASYLTVSPVSIDISLNGSGVVNVNSNVPWTASVVLGTGDLVIGGGSGTGNGNFSVAYLPQQPGPGGSGQVATGVVEVTGGGIIRLVTVTYSPFQF